ncbi:hypothetical protein BW897_11015 [Bacillus cereus]|uniref:Uncharacterized protein n=1 Tax=Bacillus cereus TaxID=1396 RepID=A0A1S9TRH2_BACCE|nr:hypothetical protein [Bacillus cereus]OOR12635.1 hypothetical protein BW897_11015 [Bacillus cereus]
MEYDVIDNLKIALDRTVPIWDPKYIIGEDNNLAKFDTWVKNSKISHGIVGSVILGQIGNGKTHFLRYIRNFYCSNKDSQMVGIYIPNMFIGGPLVNALNGIYQSFFIGANNNSLKEYFDQWESFKENHKEKVEELSKQNEVIRYLLRCSNKEECSLVLDYFSNVDLFPEQLKFLRAKFGAKKNFISNENDFSKAAVDTFEFIQMVTGRNLLILFDEVDKVYSSETRTETLTSVGLKILSAYRVLFDQLNTRGLKGLLSIGATPEAWQVLANQKAFERRFADNIITLKVPKTKKDCYDFAIKRLEEINVLPTKKEIEIIKTLTEGLDEDRTKTWADVISLMKDGNNKGSQLHKDEDPATIILEILSNSLYPLSWSDILEKSSTLKNIYPKSAPTQIFNMLKKDGKIKINPTRPKTYETAFIDEGFFDADE